MDFYPNGQYEYGEPIYTNKMEVESLLNNRMHITDNVMRFSSKGEKPEGEICYCIERG